MTKNPPCERIIGAEKDITNLKDDAVRRRDQIHDLHSKIETSMNSLRDEIKEIRSDNAKFQAKFFEEINKLDIRFASKDIEIKVEETTQWRLKIMGALALLSFVGISQLIYLVTQWSKMSQ